LQRASRVKPGIPDSGITWKISCKVQKAIYFGIKMAVTNPKKMDKFVLWT
jgi:hypothetical protein